MSLRPQTLSEVAERAEDVSQFGHEFADWLHTVRAIRSRPALLETIQTRPPFLADRFPEGNTADAWLAAYAEHVARQLGAGIPDWANHPQRIAREPWFSTDGKRTRLLALRDSPPAFKNRNLFTPKVDLPLRLRAGRPPVSAEQKRQKNAERQRRFRARRGVELELLRTLVKEAH
jgi:hypothetical protein